MLPRFEGVFFIFGMVRNLNYEKQFDAQGNLTGVLADGNVMEVRNYYDVFPAAELHDDAPINAAA